MPHAGNLKSGERRHYNAYLTDIRKDLPTGQKRCYPKNAPSFYDWKKEKGLLDSPRMVITFQ